MIPSGDVAATAVAPTAQNCPEAYTTDFQSVPGIVRCVQVIPSGDVAQDAPVKFATATNNPAPYTGTLVVLRGVSGVYARPPLTAGGD